MAITETFALVGAGPAGLACARALAEAEVAFQGYERHTGVAGSWDLDAADARVWASLHLVTSRRATAFPEMPMTPSPVDFPDHRTVHAYLRRYAAAFDVLARFRFEAEVLRAEPVGDAWAVTVHEPGGLTTHRHRGLILATGFMGTPRTPDLPGVFEGTSLHSADYRGPQVLAGRRVLVVGGGNSGCDIAAEAVHHAASVDLAMRSGAWFVPRYLWGRPVDTLRLGRGPGRVLGRLESGLVRAVAGHPARWGLPAPGGRPWADPVVGTALLHHVGRGEVRIRPAVAALPGGRSVRFADGAVQDYDVIVWATGYRPAYPYVRPPSLRRWLERAVDARGAGRGVRVSGGPGRVTAATRAVPRPPTTPGFGRRGEADAVDPGGGPSVHLVGMEGPGHHGWAGLSRQAHDLARALRAADDEAPPGRSAHLRSRAGRYTKQVGVASGLLAAVAPRGGADRPDAVGGRDAFGPGKDARRGRNGPQDASGAGGRTAAGDGPTAGGAAPTSDGGGPGPSGPDGQDETG